MNQQGIETVEITPTQFEQQVRSWLAGTSKELKQFRVTHLKKLGGPGGEYEIDAVAEFDVFGGAEIVVLVECKYYKHPVKRDVVMLLDAKLRETGAHKGMIFSTARFQSGALQYAKAHKIATILVADGKAAYCTKTYGQSREPPPWYPHYEYIGWLVSLTDEQNERHQLIADDYREAIDEWLFSDTAPNAMSRASE